MGPHLVKIFGRKSWSVEDFKYFEAIKTVNLIWNEETLKKYLANPRKYIPGNKMTVSGIKDEEQLADIIDFLKQESN